MARPKIYMHWTATPYTWKQPNHYHTIITGDGKVNRLHSYNNDLRAHTYKRNTNSVGVACACMGGTNPWSTPPTEAQMNGMCAEIARLIKEWGWTEADINIKNIMTHAEAASNKDGWHPHDNYGPQPWGGTGERWDFMKLTQGGSDDGGDQLRTKILQFFKGETPASGASAGVAAPTASGTASNSLASTREATMLARGKSIDVLIDSKGTSWAKASDLLNIYNIPFEWDAEKRRIVLTASDIFPKYLDDQVSTTAGLPTFEMALQGETSPLIMVGVIINNHGYCRVLEFAEELGITCSFNPFSLGERLGG